MTFEEYRAYVSHTLLENGFFCYLVEPPDLWKSKVALNEPRLRALCESWSVMEKNTRLLRHAVSTWRGSRQGEIGIPAAVFELYDQCQKGRLFRPRIDFPSRNVVGSWLDAINVFIEIIDPDSAKSIPVSDPVITDFWKSSLALYDFVQGIRIGGPRFWDYFEPVR